MKTSIMCLVLSAALILTSATSIAMAQDADAADAVTTFDKITGEVVDSNGKPVENFNVTIRVYDYADNFSRSPKIVKTWEGDFKSGKFEFDVAVPIAINNGVYVSRTITAPGYIELSNPNSPTGFIQLRTFEGDFKKIKLNRGVKIRGKIVLPANLAEAKLRSPKLLVQKKANGLMPNFNRMFQQYVGVSDDGTFEAMVPENCKLTLTAFADNAATTRHPITIPKSDSKDDEQDIGEIKLKEGVSVSGIVLNRQGEPIAGQVVQIRQSELSNRVMLSYILGHAVSDADGKFKLPPREGKCQISVVPEGTIDGKQIKVKGEHLIVKPMSLTLGTDKPAKEIELKECEMLRVHGVVSFTGIKPTIRIGIPSQGQKSVLVKEDGSFEAQVPAESAASLIIFRYDGTAHYEGKLSSESIAKFGQQFAGSAGEAKTVFQLKELMSDLGPLEFEMVQRIVDDRSFTERMFDWMVYGD